MMYLFACNRSSCSQFGSESWAVYTIQSDVDDDAAKEAGDDDVDIIEKPRATEGNLPPAILSVIEEPTKETIVQTREEEELQRRIESTAPEEDQDRRDLEELEREVDLKNKNVDVAYE